MGDPLIMSLSADEVLRVQGSFGANRNERFFQTDHLRNDLHARSFREMAVRSNQWND